MSERAYMEKATRLMINWIAYELVIPRRLLVDDETTLEKLRRMYAAELQARYPARLIVDGCGQIGGQGIDGVELIAEARRLKRLEDLQARAGAGDGSESEMSPHGDLGTMEREKGTPC